MAIAPDPPAHEPGAAEAKGAAEPDRHGPGDANVLAAATNLRAAALREALDLARSRRLEAESLRRERDQALRERDAARNSLDRLRRWRLVRLAVSAVRAVQRAVGKGKRTTPSGSGKGQVAAPPIAIPPGLESSDPGQYRAALQRRLRSAGGPPIRFVILGASPDTMSLAADLAALGWADGSDAVVSQLAPIDIGVVVAPDADPRSLPREVIAVAWVTGDSAPWAAQPWFDAFDIVLVPDERAARDVAAASSKTATVVAPAAAGGTSPSAAALRDAVAGWVAATRIAVMVQALRWDVAEPSGDYHLARALQRQFERRGHPTSIYFQREWTRPATAREDAVIHLWGRYELAVRPGQVNVLWVLYHPELVTDELCRRYDLLFVASDKLAARLSRDTGLEVRPLHQATDPERFRPTPGGPAHELLFVGNSRGTRRTIIDDVSPSPHDLAVYGGGWDPELVDPAHVRGSVVPNRDLPSYYGAAGIVLNDHWVEQVEAGLINNRLYDALAAGAFVISDPVGGLDEEFDGGVVTYCDAADLALKVERFLADPEARKQHVERGRRAVLARHTIAHRADDLVAAILPAVAARTKPR